jgi:hypothetical protein
MHKFFLALLVLVFASGSYAASPTKKAKIIGDFESSNFFKKQSLVSRDSWNLKSGGGNNSY